MSEEQKTDYTPEKLAIRRRELAIEYKEKMSELAEIKKKKAFKIIELMAEHGTKSKAEVYFEVTDEGQKELEITYYSKGLLELMRSIKTEVDIKNNEAFGRY